MQESRINSLRKQSYSRPPSFQSNKKEKANPNFHPNYLWSVILTKFCKFCSSKHWVGLHVSMLIYLKQSALTFLSELGRTNQPWYPGMAAAVFHTLLGGVGTRSGRGITCTWNKWLYPWAAPAGCSSQRFSDLTEQSRSPCRTCPGMEMLGWLRDWDQTICTRPGTNDGRGERVAGLCSLCQISHCDPQVYKAATAKQRGAAVEMRIPSPDAWAGKGNPSTHPFIHSPSSQPWVFNKCPVLQKHPKQSTDIALWEGGQRGTASSEELSEASRDPRLSVWGFHHRVRFPSLAHSLPNQTETQLHAGFVTICGLQFEVIRCLWSHLF